MERAGEENSGPPNCDEADNAGRDKVEHRRREDTLVEADNGDLEDGAESKVGELVREEDLREGQRMPCLGM